MKKLLLIASFIFATHLYSLAQKNPAVIYGTVAIDSVSAMDRTEVTINEWVRFIINNNFNNDFFPLQSAMSNSARLFFEDLKRQKDFEYLKINNDGMSLPDSYGVKNFRVKKKFNDLVNADTNYFSINNPVVGISFAQAKKFCEWREAMANKNKKVKIKITLPTIEVYEKIIEN